MPDDLTAPVSLGALYVDVATKMVVGGDTAVPFRCHGQADVGQAAPVTGHIIALYGSCKVSISCLWSGQV